MNETVCRPEIKICGLRRLADVAAVNAVLPEYAGFVFAESRRRVNSEEAAGLIAALDPRIRSVGVFVDHPLNDVVRIAQQTALSIIQLHGSEDAGYVSALREALRGIGSGLGIWKAMQVRARPDASALRAYCADLLLLDAWHPTEAGGVGVPFEWQLAEGLDMPYLLAGGLTPLNVRQALDQLHPHGVDVSSGVETDGWKDAEKIHAFVQAVRGTGQD